LKYRWMGMACCLAGCSAALDFDSLSGADREGASDGIDARSTEIDEPGTCADYCDEAMALCTGGSSIYLTRDSCLATCGLFSRLDPFEHGTEHALACRTEQLALARDHDDAATYCPRAAIAGTGTCEDDCDAYCVLFEAVCPEQLEMFAGSCQQRCREVPDRDSFSIGRDQDGNTLQCRLAHLIAAIMDPDAQCPQAALMSYESCVPY
jgi:hypothetical protein